MSKFYRGLKSKYNMAKHSQGLYFATDTKEILMNGSVYTGPVKASMADVKDMMAWQDVVGSVQEAFTKGGMVTLAEDMDVNEPLVVKSGVSAVLDLGGHQISNVGSGQYAVKVEEGASLIIRGEGKVYGGGNTDYSCAVVAFGRVTIESGEFSVGADKDGNGNSCIYSNGGIVVINGGTFSSDAMYDGQYWVVNSKNGTDSVVLITGGTFVNFDPAHPNTDDYPNYVANGYKSVKIEGTNNYQVVEE